MTRDDAHIRKIENGYVLTYTDYVYRLQERFFKTMDELNEWVKNKLAWEAEK